MNAKQTIYPAYAPSPLHEQIKIKMFIIFLSCQEFLYFLSEKDYTLNVTEAIFLNKVEIYLPKLFLRRYIYPDYDNKLGQLFSKKKVQLALNCNQKVPLNLLVRQIPN